MPSKNYTVDFSQVQSEQIPDGEYDANVEDVELRDSKSSEYPYLNFRLRITEGDYNGRNVFFMATLHPNGIFRAKQTFEAFGLGDWSGSIDTDDKNKVTNPYFVGKPVRIQIRNELYNSEMRPRVMKILECYSPLSDDGYDVEEDDAYEEAEDIGEPDPATAGDEELA